MKDSGYPEAKFFGEDAVRIRGGTWILVTTQKCINALHDTAAELFPDQTLSILQGKLQSVLTPEAFALCCSDAGLFDAGLNGIKIFNSRERAEMRALVDSLSDTQKPPSVKPLTVLQARSSGLKLCAKDFHQQPRRKKYAHTSTIPCLDHRLISQRQVKYGKAKSR